MSSYKKYAIVDNIFKNILIFDNNDKITFAGDSIQKTLNGFEVYPDKIVSNHFSDEEGQRLIEMLHKTRGKNIPLVFKFKKCPQEFILFPSEIKGKTNVILSFKSSLNHISQMERDLRERVKELMCLYSITHEIQTSKDIYEALDNSTEHIKQGFQYPEVTSVVIEYNGRKFINKGGSEKKVRNLLSDENILRNSKPSGEIKVIYHKKLPFLKEEYNLIKEISLKFTKAIEKENRAKLLEKQQKVLLSKNKILLRLSEECRVSREQLQTFFRAITDKIIVINSDFDLILSNSNEIGNSGKCYSKVFGQTEVCSSCPARKTFIDSEINTSEIEESDRYFNLQTYPIVDKTGKVDRILEVCRDVTKEKKMELQLLESHKLASLGVLVAGVAHEINNPNTFILGNIKIIKEAFNDILPVLEEKYSQDPNLKIARLNFDIFKENIITLIDDIYGGSVRMKKIVEDLRSYAKKDEDIFSDDVDINSMLEHTAYLMKKQITDHIKLHLQLSPDVPHFTGSISKLEQVIVNMILNAAQAIGDKEGEIRIFTKLDNLQNIVISISDNGKGMDQTTIRNIFDPFFTTKRHEGGTGLGLSISFKIIKEHNGVIDVTSKLDKGTTFTITIPTNNKKK